MLFPYIKGKAAPVEGTGAYGSTGKMYVWQAVANDQRPKLMIQMNDVDIEGLVNTGADLSILSQNSWNPNWLHQKVYTQFIGLGKLSRVRQSV